MNESMTKKLPVTISRLPLARISCFSVCMRFVTSGIARVALHVILITNALRIFPNDISHFALFIVFVK